MIIGEVFLFCTLFMVVVGGVKILYNAWGVAMNTFKINGTDFGIGEVVCEIENGIIKDLTIEGNEEITESITDDENGEWSWILYPPMVFFREVPFEQKDTQIEITEELLDEYDISFYLLEHHNIFGTLIINDNHIMISGEVRQHMNNEKLYDLEIVVAK